MVLSFPLLEPEATVVKSKCNTQELTLEKTSSVVESAIPGTLLMMKQLIRRLSVFLKVTY